MNKEQLEVIYNASIEFDGTHAPYEVVEGDANVARLLKALLRDGVKNSKYYKLAIGLFNSVCYELAYDCIVALEPMSDSLKELYLLIDDNKELANVVLDIYTELDKVIQKVRALEEYF